MANSLFKKAMGSKSGESKGSSSIRVWAADLAGPTEAVAGAVVVLVEEVELELLLTVAVTDALTGDDLLLELVFVAVCVIFVALESRDDRVAATVMEDVPGM